MQKGTRAFRNLVGMLAIAAGLAAIPTTRASEPEALTSAADFILATGREAVSILNEENGGRDKLKSLFRSRFDHALMGRYAMGSYWPKASAAEQKEFHDLFAEYVPAGYMDQLTAYRDADISVIRSQTVEDGDSMISTRIKPKTGKETVFQWRVRTRQAENKVIDIVVGGVSYLTTLREQFTAYTAKNGIDGLLNLLRERAAMQGDTLAESHHAAARDTSETRQQFVVITAQ